MMFSPISTHPAEVKKGDKRRKSFVYITYFTLILQCQNVTRYMPGKNHTLNIMRLYLGRARKTHLV